MADNIRSVIPRQVAPRINWQVHFQNVHVVTDLFKFLKLMRVFTWIPDIQLKWRLYPLVVYPCRHRHHCQTNIETSSFLTVSGSTLLPWLPDRPRPRTHWTEPSCINTDGAWWLVIQLFSTVPWIHVVLRSHWTSVTILVFRSACSITPQKWLHSSCTWTNDVGIYTTTEALRPKVHVRAQIDSYCDTMLL